MTASKKRLLPGAILLTLALQIFIACDNSNACGDVAPNSQMLEGQINGCDVRNCAFCGGWYLETSDTIYNFDYLPTGSNIALHADNFPIPVRFSYIADTLHYSDKAIKIILTEIELQ